MATNIRCSAAHVCMPVFWSCSHHVDGQFREGEVSDKSELVVRDTEELDNLLLQWSNNNLHNTHRHVRTYTHKCQSQMSVTNVSHKCQSQMSVINVRHKCQSQMSVTNVSHKCQLQMSITNVSYKCQTQMSVTNVSHKCQSQMSVTQT